MRFALLTAIEVSDLRQRLDRGLPVDPEVVIGALSQLEDELRGPVENEDYYGCCDCPTECPHCGKDVQP